MEPCQQQGSCTCSASPEPGLCACCRVVGGWALYAGQCLPTPLIVVGLHRPIGQPWAVREHSAQTSLSCVCPDFAAKGIAALLDGPVRACTGSLVTLVFCCTLLAGCGPELAAWVLLICCSRARGTLRASLSACSAHAELVLCCVSELAEYSRSGIRRRFTSDIVSNCAGLAYQFDSSLETCEL